MLAKGGSLQTVLKSFLGLVDTRCCVIFHQFWQKFLQITLQKLIGTLIIYIYIHILAESLYHLEHIHGFTLLIYFGRVAQWVKAAPSLITIFKL